VRIVVPTGCSPPTTPVRALATDSEAGTAAVVPSGAAAAGLDRARGPVVAVDHETTADALGLQVHPSESSQKSRSAVHAPYEPRGSACPFCLHTVTSPPAHAAVALASARWVRAFTTIAGISSQVSHGRITLHCKAKPKRPKLALSVLPSPIVVGARVWSKRNLKQLAFGMKTLRLIVECGSQSKSKTTPAQR
jgi:hypothetical protein